MVALKSIMHFAFEVFYKPKYKKIRIALMAIYLGYLFFLVFIDGHRFLRMKVFFDNLKNGDAFSCGVINITPFKTIKNYFRYSDHFGLRLTVINLLGNVAALVPFGVLYGSMTQVRHKFLDTVFVSCLLSTGIEAVQNLTKVGVFDVDDIILNTLGGVIGYGVYKLITIISESLGKKKENHESRGETASSN